MCDRHSATIQGEGESREGGLRLSCSPVNFACYGFININKWIDWIDFSFLSLRSLFFPVIECVFL